MPDKIIDLSALLACLERKDFDNNPNQGIPFTETVSTLAILCGPSRTLAMNQTNIDQVKYLFSHRPRSATKLNALLS